VGVMRNDILVVFNLGVCFANSTKSLRLLP
jgi:hypothetical protein